MKRIPFFVLIVLVSLSSSAQNFQAIQDNGHRLFDTGNGLRGIEVDSTESIAGDLIFYLTRTVQEVEDEWGCYDPLSQSWLGDPVRISPDGTHLFFNLQGDTIRFELQSELGETWIVYDANGLYIQGEVVSVQEETILEGIQDIVKTVSFQAMNSEMNPVDQDVNDLNVKFSENYGVIQPLNFIAFPMGWENYYSMGLESYSLVGIEGFEPGVQNLKWKEVFDFQPGDELHVKTGGISFGEGYEYRTIFRFLDRVDQGDSIIYTRQEERDFYTVSLGEYTYSDFFSETSEYVVASNPLFDQFSMSPVFTYSGYDVDYYTQFSAAIRTKGKHYNDLTSISYNEDYGCYTHILDGGCYNLAFEEYVEKKGGPYYYCVLSPFYFISRELVYYNVYSEEWGTPFNLLLNAENADKNNFKIFPNPAGGLIYLESTENMAQANIQISDLQGRILKSVRTRQDRTEIDISELPEGVFIYRIISDEKILKTGKFIVRR